MDRERITYFMTQNVNEERNIDAIISEFKKIAEQVQGLDAATKTMILNEFCKTANIDLKQHAPQKTKQEK